jgi:hypothetical protein
MFSRKHPISQKALLIKPVYLGEIPAISGYRDVMGNFKNNKMKVELLFVLITMKFIDE